MCVYIYIYIYIYILDRKMMKDYKTRAMGPCLAFKDLPSDSCIHIYLNINININY